jgi:hypothetical protein
MCASFNESKKKKDIYKYKGAMSLSLSGTGCDLK